MFASHNQHHMYGFPDMVNMLGSTPGTALHLYYGALTSHNTPLKSSKPCISKIKLHDCLSKYVSCFLSLYLHHMIFICKSVHIYIYIYLLCNPPGKAQRLVVSKNSTVATANVFLSHVKHVLTLSARCRWCENTEISRTHSIPNFWTAVICKK